jgi:MerR family transcriptional regulator, light-induced transcriptional regulator
MPTRPGRILIACPPGEEHTFSPLLLTLLLRRNGWGVVYLGANVPTDRLEATLAATQARLVIFSAQQLHTAATLLTTVPTLERRQVPLAYGGRIFNALPDLRERIPGYFLGTSLDKAVEVVEKAMNVPYVKPATRPISEAYQNALTLFRDRQAAIESDVSQALQESDMPYGTIVNANTYLSRNLVAALELGDIGFLGSEIQWVEGLLLNYRIDPSALPAYLRAYYRVAQQHLKGAGGRPILEWLAQFKANGH